MITNNDRRDDKFRKMTREEFNMCIWFALRNGDRKVAYASVDKDNVFIGGMADTFEDALYWCKKFYEEDNSIDLTIGDYRQAVTIWGTIDILHELEIISNEEYDKYIDSINFDD